MIPVSILTGFLGSGKTTLLRSLLRHPEMGRTAVIVNEFGEVGIDHDLVATSDENFVQLSNGCLCCRVRSDLVQTLLDLATRQPLDSAKVFTRVVIETSGLADPVPILHALIADADVRRDFVVSDVITIVDAVLGDATLERYVESCRQVAVADRIVMTKVDRADARPEAVEEAVRAMRPDVTMLSCVRGQVTPAALFADRGFRREAAWVRLPAQKGQQWPTELARHTSGMHSVTVVRDRPVHAATLPLFLSGLAENFGQDLVRMKGIVGIVEQPECPAVIHGVQHVYEVPEWLPGWPSADRRTRIVCLGRNLNAEWIRMLLGLLDDEVVDTACSVTSNSD